MSLSINNAASNLAILKTFSVGDKAVYNKETGEISKEDRERLVWFRRWLFSSFDTSILESTFQLTLPYLKETEIKMLNTKEINDSISENFLPALQGVEKLIATYKNENKVKTAEKIQKIYDKYYGEYHDLPRSKIPLPPPLPPPMHKETQKIITSVKKAATMRSKVITESCGDPIINELKMSMGKPLKKVEIKPQIKTERAFVPAFDSMLRRVSRPSIDMSDLDEDDWKVEKPILLRTQSERIERPKSEVRQMAPVRARVPAKKPIAGPSFVDVESQPELYAAIMQRRKLFHKSPK